ncbi:transglycosylase SLT domain-containing protein [Streptacidiphilus melanogenes]|uniref:transglycosylase SLT domain-containing protein n=1 Tax=Streptacidiphilus melanogenes TaxID=411235 RepID=UPI000693578B|nr:transglycosylase SLT domain-containing protein [Streptacidiphilus melanogenes]
MRLGLPRTRARLTAGVLMASSVAASAVLVGQHATPAQAATNETAVADRASAKPAADLAQMLGGATPTKAKAAAAKSGADLTALLGAAKPAPVKPGAARPAVDPAVLLGGATPAKPAPAKPAPAKPAAAKPAPKPAPAKPAAKPAPAKKSYPNNLDGWIAQARDILRAHGDKVPSAASIRARAMTESSGNPRAENHWDSNQALYGGTYGLIQTIKPTFAEWSLPGHKDILNPVDSIIAGVRYANDRYGSFETIAYGKQGY